MASPEANPLCRSSRRGWPSIICAANGRPMPTVRRRCAKARSGQVQIDPVPAGVPHVWAWREMLPLLRSACAAMPESFTARRALIFTNPALPRGTTQTMLATFQIVPPGEIAWAHRHTINALRFAIQGGDKVFTVVDGRALVMEPYDLILTPGWSWHDHHNQSDRRRHLDGRARCAAHAGAQSELLRRAGRGGAGESQRRTRLPSCAAVGGERPGAARPYRYPWKDTLRAIRGAVAEAGRPVSRPDARIRQSADRRPGAADDRLPDSGSAAGLRRRAITVTPRARSPSWSRAKGRTVFDDRELDWGQHDSLAMPNWTWHRHVNASRREPAILFSMSDTPILSAPSASIASERSAHAAVTPAAPMVRLSAAE